MSASLNISDRLTQAARSLRRMPLFVPTSTPEAKRARELVRLGPGPLINPDARMIVLFSPKSACTNVAIWFFHHLGQGAEARKFSHWPHRYRQSVYYPSSLYQKACKLDLTGFKVVRVIRDPYDRAASSFRHVMQTRKAKPLIARHLRDPKIETEGMSFEQFLTFLEQSDLTTCDPHFRIQRHPIEDVLPVDYLINISTDDLMERLRDVEQDLGLSPPSPAMHEWLAELKHHKRPSREFAARRDLQTRRFSQKEARRGPWPSHQAFLTPAVRERIGKLYAVDIEAYLKPATTSDQP
jgi:hypothetical protein